jgi:hypothetical protein
MQNRITESTKDKDSNFRLMIRVHVKGRSAEKARLCCRNLLGSRQSRRPCRCMHEIAFPTFPRRRQPPSAQCARAPHAPPFSASTPAAAQTPTALAAQVRFAPAPECRASPAGSTSRPPAQPRLGCASHRKCRRPPARSASRPPAPAPPARASRPPARPSLVPPALLTRAGRASLA